MTTPGLFVSAVQGSVAAPVQCARTARRRNGYASSPARLVHPGSTPGWVSTHPNSLPRAEGGLQRLGARQRGLWRLRGLTRLLNSRQPSLEGRSGSLGDPLNLKSALFLATICAGRPLAWRHTGLDFKDGGGVPLDSEGKLQWVNVPLIDTWRVMETLVEKKLVRSIGVSNFPAILLQDLLTQATIPPAVNQVENHPYLTQPALVSYCQQRGVHVSAYSPLGRPGRTKAESVIYDSTIQHEATHLSTLLTPSNTTFTPATVLLAYNVLRGLSVLPKSSTAERVAHNYESVLQLLSALNDSEKAGKGGEVRARLMDVVGGLNKNLRYCNCIIAGEKEGKFERQGPTLFE